MSPLKVGIVGAGPVVQSIHLPAIARLGEAVRVVRVCDVDDDIANEVASRVGAEAFTDVDEMLAGTELDIVAICSPHHLHAAHVEAACRAGVPVVFCEKPFAASRDEANRIVGTLQMSGAQVVVGAMHMYDPAWTRSENLIGSLRDEAHTVRSSIVMPGGSRFEDFATEVLKRASLPGTAGESEVEARAAFLSGVIYGLIIHDLPLVRRFAPAIERILDVQVEPGSWLISYEGDGRLVHLTGAMTGGWKPEWTFSAFSDSTTLEIEFQPSYVWAGSGKAEMMRDGVRTSVARADRNGYEAEWEELASIAQGAAPQISSDELVADVQYAVDLAERTRAFMLEGAPL